MRPTEAGYDVTTVVVVICITILVETLSDSFALARNLDDEDDIVSHLRLHHPDDDEPSTIDASFAAAAAADTRSRRLSRGAAPSLTTIESSSTAGGASPCQPVPYEVLWRRLELNTHPLLRHRLSTVDPTTASPQSTGGGRVRRQNVDHDQQRLKASYSSSSSSSSISGHHQHRRRQRQRHRRLVENEAEAVRRWTDTTRLIGVNSTTERQRQQRNTAVGARRNTTKTGQQNKQQQQRLRSLQQSHLMQNTRRSATPWQCRLVTRWKRMPDDVFPPFVETGNCVGGGGGGRRTAGNGSGNREVTAGTCMGGLFECVPRRYTIKVLRRVPRDQIASCYPVPTTGSNATHYEDVWTTAEHQVTVNCDCSKRREFGHYAAPPSTTRRRERHDVRPEVHTDDKATYDDDDDDVTTSTAAASR